MIKCKPESRGQTTAYALRQIISGIFFIFTIYGGQVNTEDKANTKLRIFKFS